jgi:diguanylate cyclase (GGDEF)-like protein
VTSEQAGARLDVRGLKRVARQAAALFAMSGTLTFLAAAQTANDRALVFIGAAHFAFAVAIFVFPWERSPYRATLFIAVPALVIISLVERLGGTTPYMYPLPFILLFLWIGVSQKPGAGILLAGPALVAYLGPLTTSEDKPVAVLSFIVAIPVCVLISELLSRSMEKLHASERRSQRRADLIALLADSSRTISSLGYEQVLDTVAEAVLRIGYEAACINLVDEDSDLAWVRHARGLPEAYVERPHPVSRGMVGLVREQKRTMVLADYPSYAPAIPSLVDAGFRSVIGSPVWVDERVAGVLIGASRETVRPMHEEVEAFRVLAAYAGRALENARRFEEQVRVAEENAEASLTDALTGTGNRRHANQMLDSVTPGDAVIIVDLDNFKRVNDTLGHLAGDGVLVAVGNYLRANLRKGDGVARYGGEEFVIVARQVADPKDIADRLVAGWAALGQPTTMSAGVAVHREGSSPALTLAEADEALYAAKDSGRDCAILHISAA